MRALILIVSLFASVASVVAQDLTGRHFRRPSRLPETPEAETSQAEEASHPARRDVRALRLLRSGRAWPRRHFGRLPAPRPVEPQDGAQGAPVDASATAGSEQKWLPAPARRGFWRARPR